MDLNFEPISSNLLSVIKKKNNSSCKFCHSLFSNKKNCTRHMKNCTKNNGRLRCEFTCSKCQAFFSRKDSLDRHSKICDVPCNSDGMDLNFEPTSSNLSSCIEKKNNLSCKFCHSLFSNRKNCTRHMKNCTKNNGRLRCEFTCSKCQDIFSRKDSLNRHTKICDVETSVQMSDVNPDSLDKPPLTSRPKKIKTPCLVANCNERFYQKSALISHLGSAHQDVVTLRSKEVRTFSTDQEFVSWKEEEEEKTFSYFTKKKGQNGRKYMYYYCQHDGSDKLHCKKKTSRCNNKGRIKCGHFCIAKIKVKKEEDGSIEVEYFPTHSHRYSSTDFVHHALPESTSHFINQQIAEEVSPSKIFDKVKNMYCQKDTENVQNVKVNILTKKLIRERVRRQRNAQRLHLDDSKAVFMLAKQKSEDNSLLIYKPFKGNVEVGPTEINSLPNSEELFMFAMQTDRQLQLMKKFCSKILLVDETHGTNQYKFRLMTCLIVDDSRRGWPVAHLITSRSDAATLKFFFGILKSRLDCQKINCVITDDDSAIINGMNEGFSEELRHILCLWHVIKNLKENLRTKVARELQEEVMSELRVMITEKSSIVFNTLSKGFIKKYEGNDKTDKFIAYFIQHYLSRPEKWAMCLRSFYHGDINTTGHVESFHNKLKKVYLKRKVNKRLDDLINILYNMEWEDHCCRQREANIGFSALPQHIAVRHQRGLQIADELVTEVIENTWDIRSSSPQKEVYVVVRLSLTCESDHCFSKCTNLQCMNLCSHLYSCNCPDRHPLCKHIHKLHSYLNRNLAYPSTSAEHSDFYTLSLEVNADSTPTPSTSTQSSRKQETLISGIGTSLQYINNLHTSLTKRETRLPDQDLTQMHTNLSNVVLQLEKKSRVNQLSDVTSMKPSIQFHAQEKLRSQVSQLPSFKRPLKRKRKIGVSQLSNTRNTIVKNLLDYVGEDEISK